VRLLDGPFLEAQRSNQRYLLALDMERLLAPFRREAGLPQPRPPYGNWENSGLDGHMGGHYLSALAMLTAATGDAALRARLDALLTELRRCQLAQGDGYLGGIPQGREAWARVARGELKVDSFSVNGRWVPWYNLHKTFAGLRDAWALCQQPLARQMLLALGAWALALLEPLGDAQLQDMMRAEHVGMNESFADLAARFSHLALLQPLREQRDALSGLHANTQIPKVIGFARIAELAAAATSSPQPQAQIEADWLEPARFFWRTVRERRSVAIGGNSVKEHFHALDNFQPMLDEVEGPETCNTYNMLKLSELLFAHARDGRERAAYADFYERALYNHILASQHPQGGFVYFTPMRPNHYRVYSQPQLGMWCCVGSGLESQARHGQFIFAQALGPQGPEVYINLFIAARLDWPEQGLRLSQQTRFPAKDRSLLEIERGGRFTLHLRHPGWVAPGALRLRINGQPQAVTSQPGDYLSLNRDWRAGDRVELQLPMALRSEPLGPDSGHVALLHGPIVLAAKTHPLPGEVLRTRADDSRMGHIAQGPLLPQAQAPLLISAGDADLRRLRPLPGRPQHFSAGALIQGLGAAQQDLTLMPFYQLHDARYMVYWARSTPAQARALRERLAAEERAQLALQARTVDSVAPGEQQPESDHGFAGEGMDSGLNKGRRWRHARAWFSYRLLDPRHEGRVLRLEFCVADRCRRFSVQANERLLAELTLHPPAGLAPDQDFYTLDLALPADLPRRDDGSLLLRFTAAPGSLAGGLYGLRLLR
jgi:DUF1680 family protein